MTFRIPVIPALLLCLMWLPVRIEAAGIPGDWSMFGNGPSHTGYQPGTIGKQQPFLVWRKEVDQTYGSLNPIAVAADRVFVTPGGGNILDDSYVLALDANSGDEVWRHQFPEFYGMDPPSYANGKVYVQRGNTSAAFVDSFDAATGKLNWSTPVAGSHERGLAPTIADGKIWLNGGTEGGMYGLNQADGTPLFFVDLFHPNSEWTPTYHQGRLFAWTLEALTRHDPATGEFIQGGTLGPYPGYSKGSVAIASNGKIFLQAAGMLVAVNLFSLNGEWAAPDFQLGNPAVVDSYVYAVKERQVKRFDVNSGSQNGVFTAPQPLISLAQPILTDDMLIVSSASVGETYLVDRFTMQLVNTIPDSGSLALADDKLYIVNDETVSAWHVAYRSRTGDNSPKFYEIPESIELPHGLDDISVDIAALVSDPDDDDNAIYLSVTSNSHEDLVSAKVIDHQLVLSFADYPGETRITMEANSFGRKVSQTLNLTLSNPDIQITLLDSEGNRIQPGDTVSGIISGNVAVTNKMSQHAQFYQNFRSLPVNESGHLIDSNNWMRSFSVDTSLFFDGENLLSVHVHPENSEAQPYLNKFDVGLFKIITENNNPAPNGDVGLPTMEIDPQRIVVRDASLVPGHTLEVLPVAFKINDDFGEIDFDLLQSRSDKAQVIPHLGTSVLGRFRWVDRDPPFGDRGNGIFEGIHLINFQRSTESEATLVFFFNDDAGRANYAFHALNIPPLPAADRTEFPLPALDAKILNVSQGDEIIIHEDETFKLQVEVHNPQVLGTEFPRMSTWIGNRSVAITDLTPYIETMPPDATSFLVEVEVPTAEIRKLQESRLGGPDSSAFAIWVDFAAGERLNLPASEHVHVSMIRTADLEWPYGPPTVEIRTPVENGTDVGGIDLELYVYGDLTEAEDLYVRLNDDVPIRIADFDGTQGLLFSELTGYQRQPYTLQAYFTDASGTPLAASESSTQVNFELINDLPVSVIDAYVLDQDESLQVEAAQGLLSNDLDLEGDVLTVSQLSPPTHGDLNWSSDGSFTYLPDPGFAGKEKLQYLTSDGYGNGNAGLLVISVLPSVSPGVAGDWHMLGNGPSHTGYQPGYLDLDDPVLVWRRDIASATGNINPVAVADNQVFITPDAWYNHTYVMSLDAASGDEIWRFDFDEARSINPPAFSEGNLYLQQGIHAGLSRLWSFNAYTGEENWQAGYLSGSSEFYAPTIADGKIWIATGLEGGVFGFDQSSGQQLFYTPALSDVDEWTPLYHQGRVFSWERGLFREYHPVTGQLLREINPGEIDAYTQAGAAVAEAGIAYLQDASFLTAVRLSDFSILWQANSSQKGTPAVADGVVYLVDRDRVRTFDAVYGVELGSYTAPAKLIPSTQPLLSDDKLIVSSADQVFLVDRFSLQPVASIEVGGNLTLADDRLYVAGNGEVSVWQITQHEDEADLPPLVGSPIPDLELEQGAGSMVIDLSEVFFDADDDPDSLHFILVSNSNDSLLAATILGDQLYLDFSANPGETEIVIRANSSGKVTETAFNVRLKNPAIQIEIFDSEGLPVDYTDPVSGIITGKVSIFGKSGQRAQLLQNFRVLEANEPGLEIDSESWERTFSIDTTSFFDGENLVSVQVYGQSEADPIYPATFDVGTLKITTWNDNPAPNGDTRLPSMTIRPDGIALTESSHIPGGLLETLPKAVTISDDFGVIDIDQKSDESGSAQVISLLGDSVLGRNRTNDSRYPYARSIDQVISGAHLINFQTDSERAARLIFFFNDDAGRANYGYYNFNLPPLAPEDRVDYPLPGLDARILNLKNGDDIVIQEDESFVLQVEVTDPRIFGLKFPHMSTWAGNRLIAATELWPHIQAMSEEQTSFVVDVTIPAREVEKLQESRQGGQDASAFVIWNDFAIDRELSLPGSEHVLATLRTSSLEWPYGDPSVEIVTPLDDETLAGDVTVELYLSGNLSLASDLYIQVNGKEPQRVDEFTHSQGLLQVELVDPARSQLAITVYFTDQNGTPLNALKATDSVTFNLLNDPPIAVLDSFTLDQDGILMLAAGDGLLANDRDLEGDALSVSAIERAPQNGTLSWEQDGSLVYTPDPDFVGTDRLYYRVTDGFDVSAPGIAVFTVAPELEVGVPGNWPTFGNDPSHSGFQPGFIGSRVPAFLWEKQLDNRNASLNQVAVGDRRVYVTYKSLQLKTVALSLDAATGEEIWRSNFDEAASANPPSFADGDVYFQRGNHMDDSQLISLNAATGHLNWRTPYTAQWGEYYAPTISNGSIWVNGGGALGLYGFDQLSGNQLFFINLEYVDEWTPLYHQGKLYSWTDRTFREHDPETGEIWQSLQLNDLTIYGNYAVAVAEDGVAFVQADTSLTAIRLADFSIAWQVEVSQRGTPAIAQGMVYVVEGNKVTLFDALNGYFLAEYEATEELIRYSQPLLTNDRVMVSSDSRVYVLDRFTLQPISTIDQGGLLSLADNTLYIAGDSSISAWNVASRDPVLQAQDEQVATFDVQTAELTLPLLKLTSAGPDGIESSTYYADTKLALAPECGELTLAITGGEPVTESHFYFTQGDSGQSISTHNLFDGEFSIPRIDMVEGDPPGQQVIGSFAWVKLKPSVQCPASAFDVISAK